MSIEQKINYQLDKYPATKKIIKRIYQRTMCAISHQLRSTGKIIRVSPNDSSHEYFFGYYDKSRWEVTDRYMLCFRAKDVWSDVSSREPADFLLIDTQQAVDESKRVVKIAGTQSWNVQQGACCSDLAQIFKLRYYVTIFASDNIVRSY